MENKKSQYYALDDIGFVGTQSRISKAQLEKDMERTSLCFDTMKSASKASINVRRLSKARRLIKVR